MMFGISSIVLGTALSVTLGVQAEPVFPEGRLALKELVDTAGRSHILRESKLTVLVFVSVDCPIANRYAPEVLRAAADYKAKGVKFITVYADPTTTREEVKKHQTEFGIDLPAVQDPKHRLVKLVGASVTPEVAVLSSESRLLYRGRIDDSWSQHSRPRTSEARRDLRIALDQALAGKPVEVRWTPAVGCPIPDL